MERRWKIDARAFVGSHLCSECREGREGREGGVFMPAVLPARCGAGLAACQEGVGLAEAAVCFRPLSGLNGTLLDAPAFDPKQTFYGG